MPTLVCDTEGCNNKVERANCLIKKSKTGKFYCSKQCQHSLDSVEMICKGCGNTFKMWKSRLKYSKNHFCSRKCWDESRPKKQKYQCIVCHNDFYIHASQRKRKNRHRCCSKKCSNELKTLYPNTAKIRIQIKCRIRASNHRKELHEEYIKNLIISTSGLKHFDQIPTEAVEAYRITVAMKRQAKKHLKEGKI